MFSRPALRKIGSSWFFAPTVQGSEDWQRQQTESIDRYQDQSYEADGTIGRVFGGFIATTIDRSGLILDIGCGLHADLPPYAAELDLAGYLGVEPLTTPVERRYACIAGVLAEDLPLRDDVADAAVFATSLDHIEKAREAIRDTVRVLKPGAPLYFWLGVHDPETLAASKSFANIHIHSHGLRRWARVVGAPLEHLRLIWQMRRRRADLLSGRALDTAHVRYHTAAGVDREFDGYGLRIVRRLYVPGFSSLFVEAVSD